MFSELTKLCCIYDRLRELDDENLKLSAQLQQQKSVIKAYEENDQKKNASLEQASEVICYMSDLINSQCSTFTELEGKITDMELLDNLAKRTATTKLQVEYLEQLIYAECKEED